MALQQFALTIALNITVTLHYFWVEKSFIIN